MFVAVILAITACAGASVSTKKYNEISNYEVPLWKRYTFTIDEAAAYYHIGQAKLRAIVDYDPTADFIIYNGNRVLIKKGQFEKYLDNCTTV